MATVPTVRGIRRKLRRIIRENGDPLASCVAAHALEDSDPLAFLSDVTTHGCMSGCVPGLVYYCDTRAFFDTYYAEIEDLRRDFEDATGSSLEIRHDLKNDLAWFAFEETALRLLDQFEAR